MDKTVKKNEEINPRQEQTKSRGPHSPKLKFKPHLKRSGCSPLDGQEV